MFELMLKTMPMWMQVYAEKEVMPAARHAVEVLTALEPTKYYCFWSGQDEPPPYVDEHMKYLIYGKSHAILGPGSCGWMGYMELLTEQPLSLQGSLKGNAAMEVATNTVRDTLQRAYLLQNKLHCKMRDQPSPPGWDHSGYPKYCSLKVSLHYKFLNEQDLQRNRRFFKVPQASIESIRSKLAFKLFDEFTNILKGMYSMRFNGTTADGDIPAGTPSDQGGPAPSRPGNLINLL